MHITRITAVQVHVPYAPPVGPYRGRGEDVGTLGGFGLIVKVETDAGVVGWGEGLGGFSSDPTEILAGRHAADIEGALAAMEGAGMGAGPVSAVEMALWDAVGKQAGLPVCRLMGGLVREEVEFTGCIGLKDPSESAATAREYIERWGFRYLKTKAGNDPEEDLRIAAAIQEEIGDDALLRPDANCGYGPTQAEEVLKQMSALGIRYFEDPCAGENLDTLRRIRQETGIHVLVNMGVATADTVLPLLAHEAADTLMPDFPMAGGMLRVRKVAAVAEAYGVPCLMHCSHDLGLKTAAIAQVAACTPNFSGPNDTCYHGLTDDVLTEPLQFRNGRIRVPLGPGLGVEVDEAKIEQYRVS